MEPSKAPEPPQKALPSLRAWGSSSLPPMGLATLITALHLRPLQIFPLSFAPVLVFASYLNVGGFVIDSAGLTAAWSGLYALLALRRRQPGALRARFSARGLARGTAIGLGGVNCAAGGWVWATGDRQAEGEERKKLDKWGVYGSRG